MDQADTQNGAGRRRNAMTTTTEACTTDDVTLMEEAIALASQPGSRHTVQDTVQQGLKRSAARNAVRVLKYLLDQGADVTTLSASEIMANDESVLPSQEVLDTLVAHGWDVNTQGPQGTAWPLLWHVIEDHDLVKWCLDHGAHADTLENPPEVKADGTQNRKSLPRPMLTGIAAHSGTIATFELLRSKDSLLDPRALHCAVEQAAVLAPAQDEPPSTHYVQRMEMVRHLVDVVKMDVNAVKRKAGSMCSTPLCCVASRHTTQDFSELLNFLLDRGADPDLDGGKADGLEWPSAMTCAQSCGNENFLRIVQAWGTRQSGDGQDRDAP